MLSKNLLALPLLSAGVLLLIAAVSPYACSSPTPQATPVVSLPQRPDIPIPPTEPKAGPVDDVPEPPPPPEPDQPRCHTLTIYNGDHVLQQTFVWRDGSWRSCGDDNRYDVFFRDGPCSPWRYYGTYCSPRRAEKAACFLRASGNLTSVRQHCA
jgi:hypothetical protein